MNSRSLQTSFIVLHCAECDSNLLEQKQLFLGIFIGGGIIMMNQDTYIR